ncbi:hypothetical protein GOBAR_AA27866 [Gossypium barbadense]|uniref:Uncharacterized protein n=1 Tax=Gossypium barbadense TaxID=3634 RepID=A0A2P5WNY0_GOSBA|nr:hypothetical protein GOBAR_AA27866 [Gossypium barbadense]
MATLSINCGEDDIWARKKHTSHSQAPVEDLFMKIEDYKMRNSMNGRCTNQEHLRNRNYAKMSPIPLQINLSIFPFNTVEVSHPKFDTFKVNNTRLKRYFDEIDSVSTETRPSTRACLRPFKNRAKDFPNTDYD